MNEESRAIRQAYFEKVCPPLYQGTDPGRLPAEQFAQVTAWTRNPQRGLYLVGPSRTGKTRCVWELLRHVILTSWSTVKAYDSLEWQTEVSQSFGNVDTTRKWIEGVCNVDILFIDDIFKGKLTPAQALAVHGVIERRAAHLKPIFCTSNADGANISSRIEEETTAESILGRITDFCEVIEF